MKRKQIYFLHILKYSESLEELLSSVFEIQTDLKDILKEQSSLISSQTKQRKSKN